MFTFNGCFRYSFITFFFTVLMSSNSYSETVLSLSKGLTLAQVYLERKTHTIVVTEDNNRTIVGYDISALSGVYGNPVQIYNTLGKHRVVDIIKQNASATRRFAYESLLSPAGKGDHHIALGLNYRAHANEVDAREKPFLFLKTIRPTREEPIDFSPKRLLDYEVELCARPLTAISESTPKIKRKFAYFLCGDMTDRALLLKNINLENIQSGRGFSEAKSLPNYFPTGPFLVIPDDPNDFLNKTRLTLKLSRNNHEGPKGQAVIKQNDAVKNRIWDIDTSIDSLFRWQKNNILTYSPKSKTWLPNGVISEDTTLLTGTPDGVIFRPPSLWYRIKWGTVWFFSAKFLDQSAQSYVIERYINHLKKEELFLQSGDRVLLSAKHLGSIDIRIE